VKTALSIVAGFALAASSMPLMAHHSMAEYDNTKPLILKGTVTSLEWKNPHVLIHVDVPGKGRIIHWDLETWGTGQLSVRGLTNGFVKPGDRLSVHVFSAKDGTARAVVRGLTLPDGQVLDGPPGEFPR
jgi:hypothetical protein